MYAVVRQGGRQHTVKKGDTVHVARLAAEVGSKVTFEDVLAVRRGNALKLGQPTVDGASVEATVLEHGLGDKVIVFKMKRRKHYRRTRGHRQGYTAVRIDRITAGATKSSPAKQDS
jgi:large subunit ribosomal protein L21